MTDQLIPVAVIDGDFETPAKLYLSYDVIEHKLYALTEDGEESWVVETGFADQEEANDYIQASYGSGWGLEWAD